MERALQAGEIGFLLLASESQGKDLGKKGVEARDSPTRAAWVAATNTQPSARWVSALTTRLEPLSFKHLPCSIPELC